MLSSLWFIYGLNAASNLQSSTCPSITNLLIECMGSATHCLCCQWWSNCEMRIYFLGVWLVHSVSKVGPWATPIRITQAGYWTLVCGPHSAGGLSANHSLTTSPGSCFNKHLVAGSGTDCFQLMIGGSLNSWTVELKDRFPTDSETSLHVTNNQIDAKKRSQGFLWGPEPVTETTSREAFLRLRFLTSFGECGGGHRSVQTRGGPSEIPAIVFLSGPNTANWECNNIGLVKHK